MEDIKKILEKAAPGKPLAENTQYPTIEVEGEEVHTVAQRLKDAGFDYLMSITGMDYGDALGCIYHISASGSSDQVVVLKNKTTDRENPMLYTVSDVWEIANLYEREVYDFFGIMFINHPDMRRLFLRGDWVGYPLRKDYSEKNEVPVTNVNVFDLENMPSITIEGGKVVRHDKMLFGNNDYVVNFGPQHPSTHGVLHLRVKLDGEQVAKIDPNFGYIHRGIEKMAEKLTYPQILPYTERLDYLSSAINRHALCMAVENGAGIEVPERAKYVRVIFDELTRIASHLLGWASMTNDMGAITAFIYGMRDREKIQDIFEGTSGGRLMTAYSVVGGLAQDIAPDFQKQVKEFIPYMRGMLKEYHTFFSGNPIATGRMHGVGKLTLAQAAALGCTGPTGRASGWHNDVRKLAPYSVYDKVDFKEVIRNTDTHVGDSYDRYIIRLDEIEESLKIIEQLVDNIPDGEFKAKTPAIVKLPAGEYHQRVENARGDFDVFICSDGGKTPARVHFRSPSLPLVAALDPLCRDEKIADLIMIGGSLDYVIPCIDR